MDSSPDEIIKDIPPFIRVYKDGRYQKLGGTDIVPAGVDPTSGVQSKDVVISPDTPLSVRLYIPKTPNSNTKKLPLVIYFHGGGFIIESAASPTYHNFLNLVTAESDVVVVSVDYRTAPDHPVPACYHDSWEAVKWVSQHVDGNGADPWLNEHADFRNVFFAGDSAGANIAHHMAIQIGSENSGLGINLEGIILLHPYFWGRDRLGLEADNPWITFIDYLWAFVCPGTSGSDDPFINPDFDPNMSNLVCSRVLVFVAENDLLKHRGRYYQEILGKNGWKGDIEVIEDKGANHVYFLSNPTSDDACTLRKKIGTFINQSYSQ